MLRYNNINNPFWRNINDKINAFHSSNKKKVKKYYIYK